MNSDYTIYVVDDDPTSRVLLQTMLSEQFEVELFESAESCLERLEVQLPNLFLLETGLPGIDGFELCRRIKSIPESSNIPVVFVSGHDSFEDELAGYDAGGQDYVVKPFDVVGLYHKIENLKRIELHRKDLLEQAKSSDELASLVMANLDEYAILIKFLRTLNECSNAREIVDALLHVLEAFHLEGAVQVRMRNLEKTFSKAGENWPLEIAVINHVRSLERIFEFKQRSVYNFDHLTILITNMPVADCELCGRIRDNIAIAAESADAKLIALQSIEDKAKMRGDIGSLLSALEHTVQDYSKKYDNARYQGSVYTDQFLDDLLASFSHLGMSDRQEEEILTMVKERSNGLVNLYDIAGETQATLAELSRKLETILATTSTPNATSL